MTDLNIEYRREEIFDYYSIDNYLVDCNGIIEVMGDYWHSNPLRYNENRYSLNEVQAKQLHRDKIKYSYIQNHYDIPILYIWETDVKTNIEMCKLLIHEYVSHNRILPNYHSFNWNISSNILQLNTNLIIPYQDLRADVYRYLIKRKTG